MTFCGHKLRLHTMYMYSIFTLIPPHYEIYDGKEKFAEKCFLSIMSVVEPSCVLWDSLFTFFLLTRDFPFHRPPASPLSRAATEPLAPIQQTFFADSHIKKGRFSVKPWIWFQNHNREQHKLLTPILRHLEVFEVYRINVCLRDVIQS